MNAKVGLVPVIAEKFDDVDNDDAVDNNAVREPRTRISWIKGIDIVMFYINYINCKTILNF